MARIKGELEYRKYKEGAALTRRQAILAHCFECALMDGPMDCGAQGKTCALYSFFPYRLVKDLTLTGGDEKRERKRRVKGVRKEGILRRKAVREGQTHEG